MATDSPHLPLARYALQFRALEPIRLQQDPRRLWHGIFGRSLRELSCTTRRAQCDGCPELHACDYSYLFSAPRPPGAEIMQRYDRAPPPHIVQLGDGYPRDINPNEPLPLSVVLVGEANRYAAKVIRALATAGLQGLGRQRGKVQLEQVRQYSPTSAQPVEVNDQSQRLPPPGVPITPPLPAWVRVTFLSPYKPPNSGRHPTGIDLGRFLMAIVRRISLLQYFYTGQRLFAPFTELKAISQQAQITAHNLYPVRMPAWISQRGRKSGPDGLLGHFDLVSEHIAPLWPYLYLGQWLNLGKEASMGFGQYRLDTL